MKIYLDTADIEAIKLLLPTGLVDGVTTNPTHLAQHGGSPRECIDAICTLLPNRLISVEVTEKDPGAVYTQAKAIASIAHNILVKIPCHADYYAVIGTLVAEGICINVTLLFSVFQALCMFKLGVHTISPFVGRLYDNGIDGLQVLADICAIKNKYGYKTEVLAASVRDEKQVEGALQAGVDAITISPTLFQHLTQHPLTDKGIAQFDKDWRSLGSNIHFP